MGRACLRAIKPKWVGTLLLVLLIAWQWRPLGYALTELPGYLAGRIQFAPPELDAVSDGRTALIAGDLARARASFERSMAIDPNTEAAYLLALTLYRLGEFESAIRWLDHSLSRDQLRAIAWLGRAQLALDRGRTALARQILERGLQHFQQALPHYQVVPDRSVGERYNRRAETVVNEIEIGIALLRSRLAALGARP